MFNAHWLTYFDETCTRFMESLGFGPDFWINEFDVMLVKAVLEWSGPARFDEWIDIAVAADPARHEVVRPALPRPSVASRCTGDVTYVAVNPARHLVEIPDEVRAACGRASRAGASKPAVDGRPAARLTRVRCRAWVTGSSTPSPRATAPSTT